jgi:hypothetical protein
MRAISKVLLTSPLSTGALWMVLVLVACLSARAQEGKLLIPVYDAFEDVSALMTPSFAVELNSTHQSVEGTLVFSRMHRGKSPIPGAARLVLLTLVSPLPFFAPDEFPRLVILADGRRAVHEDFELLGREGAGMPILTLRLWLDGAEVAELGRAAKVECRAGRFDFQMPRELLDLLPAMVGAP